MARFGEAIGDFGLVESGDRFPGFRADLIEDHLAREGYAYEMRSAWINLTVKAKIQPGETFWSLCAGLRRGALHKYAERSLLGALGPGDGAR